MQSCAPKHTTKRLEWWGWFGVISWFVFMMYAPEMVLYQDVAFGIRGNRNDSLLFMVVFVVSIIGFSFVFGKTPNKLSRIAFCTTPIALIITAVFVLLPYPFGSILYVLSPALMAPALARRAFGVLHSVKAGRRLTFYISAFVVSVLCYSVWLVCDFPTEIAFLFPALLAVPAWLGIHRIVALSNEPTGPGVFKLSGRLLFLLIGALIALFWLGTMNAVIHTCIISTGIKTSDTLLTLLSLVLPVVGFLLYGLISDRGHERTGIVCGMMLFIAGIIIALVPGVAQKSWVVPLIFTNSLGGSYFEFLMLTLPVFFLANAKRPVFVASLGIVINLVYMISLWGIELWLPEMFRTIDAPLLLTTSISVIGFVVLLFVLFEQYREKTLISALYALSSSTANGEKAPSGELMGANEKMATIGLTQEETAVALLLLEGKSRSEIARKLRLKSVETSSHMKSIRNKLSGGDPDPAITTIVREHNLTRRETDVLRCLRNGMTNPQIAAELIISEATVKNHVSSLMGKLRVDSRYEIPSLIEFVIEKQTAKPC